MLVIIILLLVLIWFLRPLFKLGWTIHKARKQYNDMFRQATGETPRRETQQQRKGGWSTPPRREKKIPRDTGEYVKFSEVDVKTESTTTGSDGKTTDKSTWATEQQIVDVTWQDIH